MTITTLLIIIVLIVLLGGGGAYYVGPLRPEAGPNNIVGLLVTVLVIALLLRLLGIY